MSLTGLGSAWLLPAAKEAWKHRNEIQSIWTRVATRLFGQRRSIAFTGMAGAGKTVLFDHITGNAFKAGYRPPPISQVPEKGKLLTHRKKIALTVVPGQDSAPRLVATDSLFGKESVHGVVHVVCNGFAALRSSDAKQYITEHGLQTIEQFQEVQRREELRDLDDTCNLIRQSIRKHKEPRWMIVAVSKIDLYYDNLSRAAEYYSPSSDSPFAERMRKLEHKVGADNFRWSAVPVCSSLEDFTWGEHTIVSNVKVKTQARDHYLAAFVEAIDNHTSAGE